MSSSPPPSSPVTSTAPAPGDKAAARAVLGEYRVVQTRVDAFFAAVLHRHPTQLQCQSGCHGCCQAGLSVSAIEAAAIRDYVQSLPEDQRAQLRAHVRPGAALNRAALGSAAAAASCALLTRDGRCTIYPARPLVCRSQGLPLAYEAALIPEGALRFRAKDGRAVVVCPLNFSSTADPAGLPSPSVEPAAADILDGERLDVILALLNHRYIDSLGADRSTATARVPLADVVLDCNEPAPT